MSKHLVMYGTKVTDLGVKMLELEGWMYWKKRIQFWKWKLHRTMGKPVLILRKAEL